MKKLTLNILFKKILALLKVQKKEEQGNMHHFRQQLQGQHYKMAAIVAEGWAYEEQIEEGKDKKRGRKKSVCQFDTSKLFEYTSTEKKQNKSKYFDYMANEKNRAKKIDKCISDPPNGGNANVLIDKLFTSHLITQETEAILEVLKIEENFLNLIKISDDFNQNKKHIIFQEVNVKIMKDYIALQYIRNPLFYKFLINSYLHAKTDKIFEIIEEGKDLDTALLFRELTILNDRRLNELINFCNDQIIILYNQYRKMLEDYSIFINTNNQNNNYLGDLSSFNFNFERFGVQKEVQKFIDYENNKEILSKSIYTVVSSKSSLMAIEKSTSNVNHVLNNLINPVIKKGIHNNLIYIYSKYILCHPINKIHMLDWIKDFFNNNTLQDFYNAREENIAYLETLELLLIRLKEKEKLFR